MNDNVSKEKVIETIKKRQSECEEIYKRYIELNPTDIVRKKTHEVLMIEYAVILSDLRKL